MTWRAAMYLDKEYVDVLKTKDPYVLLESAIQEDCLQKLIVMSDIMTSMKMTHKEIADFLAEKIAIEIIKSKFYLLNATVAGGGGGGGGSSSSHQHRQHHQQRHWLWGYDLDKEFRLFLELCPNTSALGTRLLRYCDALKVYRRFDPAQQKQANPEAGEADDVIAIYRRLKEELNETVLSHKKQNTISVELLIKAHECFVHECYMEGIAWVLQRTKQLNGVLAQAKSWRLIVKMLMGIGRYRDMYYCFETLIANDQFESLLGQFDDDRGLQQAIISYLHDTSADESGGGGQHSEHYRLAALHFQMFKEIAQMWTAEATKLIDKIIADHVVEELAATAVIEHQQEETAAGIRLAYLECSVVVAKQLTTAMEAHAHAAENYLMDNKLALAQRSANAAELVALQINLLNIGMTDAMALGSPVSSSPTATADQQQQRCICVVDINTAQVHRHHVNNDLRSVSPITSLEIS